MINHNCMVNIYRMTGDEDNKEYELLYEDVRILMLTASNETISYYPDVPTGYLYSFLLMDKADNIAPEDKFVISNPLNSKLNEATSYIVKGKGATKIIMSHTIVDGVCLKI